MKISSPLFWASWFIVALLAQSLLWYWDPLADEALWIGRAEAFFADIQDLSFLPLHPRAYSGHPGMSVVTVTAALHATSSLSFAAAIPLSISILNALTISGSALLARRLVPGSWWWLFVGGVALLHPLYVQTTPTNAVTAPLLVCIVLFTWWCLSFKAGRWHWFWLGILMGVGVATRFVTITVAGGMLSLLLVWERGRQFVTLLCLGALLGLVLLDPLLIFVPKEYLSYVLFHNSQLLSTDNEATISLQDFIVTAPLSLISFIAGWILLLPRMRHVSPIPAPLLGTILGATSLLSILFLSTRAPALRHFFPLILLWEILFPLFLLRLLQLLPDRTVLPRLSLHTALQLGMMVLLIGGNFILLSFLLL